MRKKTSFTLIELLVIIVIIGLLVMMLAPALNRARERTRRTVCGTNLSAIGKTMGVYAGVYDSYFPVAACAAGDQWAGRTGVNRTTPSDPNSSTVSVTSSQWILIREGYVAPSAFVCLSTNNTVDTVGATYYDFSSRNCISYSFQIPYGDYTPTRGDHPSRGMAADKSPFFDNPTGTLIQGVVPAQNAPATNNSRNHVWAGEYQGQNVMFVDNHVIWAATANVGLDGDHIFTRCATWPARAVGTIANNDLVTDPNDTVLAP
jgi:type II secretory pathway pseudopilin PulG